MSNSKLPVVVVGDGWAAMGAVAFLLKNSAVPNQPIVWIKGTGARMLAPLPTLEASHEMAGATQGWLKLAENFEIPCGELNTGCFLREYRNKAFREPVWTKAATPEQRQEVRNETLWSPELNFSGSFEARFEKPIGEIEEILRSKLLSEEYSKRIRRIEQLPLCEVKIVEGKVERVVLGSGEEIACEQLVYADRWSALPSVEGLPPQLKKTLSSSRKWGPVGVVQAVFSHEPAVGVEVSEGFFSQLNKEAGEEIDRNIWGYFFQDGKRSVWSLCLTEEEVEDNHEIAKKFRRMKAALDKIFSGSAWLPQGKTDLSSTVSDEHVRFEDALLFSKGTPQESLKTLQELTRKMEGLTLFTDSFGPSWSMHQVWKAYSQTEAVNLETTAASEVSQNTPLSC